MPRASLNCSVPLIHDGVATDRFSAENIDRTSCCSTRLMPKVASSVSSGRPYRKRIIVRSISTPASPGNGECRGNRDEDRSVEMPRHRDLHEVGRVRAEHHQLAMGHVDDAHDAERDGQPDRNQHEHRPEAEAEEQRFNCGIERPTRVDVLERSGRCLPHHGVAFDESAVGRFLHERASLFRTSEPSTA